LTNSLLYGGFTLPSASREPFGHRTASLLRLREGLLGFALRLAVGAEQGIGQRVAGMRQARADQEGQYENTVGIGIQCSRR
jgi:hypothetical protein